MICIHCGKELADDEKYCTSCGNKTDLSHTAITTTLPVIIQVLEEKEAKKTKKKKLYYLFFLIPPILVLFLGLNIFFQGNNSRTIMIYMVGADLESRIGLASRDLQDLNFNQINKNKGKVVLLAGGSKTWQNNYIQPTETSIYELRESGFVKVKTKSLENMGEKETLSYFLNYTYRNYKSKQYDFIFWNHGGAIDGSEYDELNQNDNLKISEMDQAFARSPFKKHKIEVLSFRTCLNATIEIANTLQKYARYLVASEEVTIGSNQDSALRFINQISPKDDGINFGKKQINTYLETVSNSCNYSTNKNGSENYCVNTTYSLIDLSKINSINKELESFAKDLNQKLNQNYQDFSRIRTNLSAYADTEKEFYEMVDLYDLAKSYEEYSTFSKSLRNSIEKAVIINKTNNQYSHGLSIYYPFYNGLFIEDYSKIASSKNYDNYATNFYQYKKSNSTSAFTSFNNQSGEFRKENEQEADFEMDLTEEQEQNLAAADCLVFADNKDGTYKLVYISKNPYLEDHKLKLKVKGKLLKISDMEYEDESQWLTLTEEKNSNTLTTSVLLKKGLWDDTIATLNIEVNSNNPNGKITSITVDDKKEQETFSLLSKRTVSLEDYITITSIQDSYPIKDKMGNYDPFFAQKGNKVYEGYQFATDEFKLIKETFNNKTDFYAVFRVLDIYGNTYYSNISNMQ